MRFPHLYGLVHYGPKTVLGYLSRVIHTSKKFGEELCVQLLQLTGITSARNIFYIKWQVKEGYLVHG